MALTLAMFPGQGSQFVGMGRELLQEFPKAATIFEEASDAIKVDIRKLCLEGPEDQLKLTANTQPCILTHSVAVWHVLRSEAGFAPDFFAGHSLGEYSALVAAGVLALDRAAFLVRRRGEAMQEAVPAGVGAMAAVMNCEDLEARCAKVSKPGAVVEVANFNSPQQSVVAGHKSAVESLAKGLEADGVRFVMLPVSAPFHSSLMEPAREAMAPLLEDTQFATPSAKIIPNLTGKVVDSYDASYLIKQINSPVLWTQTLETAQSEGCESYCEVGPGKVLFGLARRSLPRGVKLIQTEDLKKALAEVQGT